LYYLIIYVFQTPIGRRTRTAFDCYFALIRKRSKNVMIQVREVFRFAQPAGYIKQNPMDLITSPKVIKPDIHPLSIKDVNIFRWQLIA